MNSSALPQAGLFFCGAALFLTSAEAARIIAVASSGRNIGWLYLYHVGIARPELAQFVTHWFGVAFLVEELLPLVIGRPPAVAPVIPARDSLVGSRSKRDAIGHCTPPFDCSKGVLRVHTILERWPVSIVSPGLFFVPSGDKREPCRRRSPSMAVATVTHKYRLDIPAPAPRAHEPLAPIDYRKFGTMDISHVSRVSFVLMPARLAPDD